MNIAKIALLALGCSGCSAWLSRYLVALFCYHLIIVIPAIFAIFAVFHFSTFLTLLILGLAARRSHRPIAVLSNLSSSLIHWSVESHPTVPRMCPLHYLMSRHQPGPLCLRSPQAVCASLFPTASFAPCRGDRNRQCQSVKVPKTTLMT